MNESHRQVRLAKSCNRLPSQPAARQVQTSFNWRNDYAGIEQWSRNIVRDHYVQLLELHKQHERFAKQWDNNLRLQGFAEAFEQQQQTPRA